MNADFDPTSIDLARESDFSAGDLKVRPSLRQVESEAGAETLEPRVMQVLVALFQRRGEVVSRDELIQRCWGGRVVGEDAISRAIARVRKLGESTGAFNLETIPKVGYRMMGMTAVGVPDAATPPSPGRWAQIARSPLALPIGIIAVIVIAAAFWLGGQGGQASADAVVERLAEQSQQRASPGQIKTVGAAVQALGASDQSAERSAFDALASGDGIAAINMLEAYAAELEGRGENKQAADVYTKIGAISLVVDLARGLSARRKAVLLDPSSLLAFQGLFLDTLTIRREQAALDLASEALARPGLSDQMRAWVLTHRGLVETEMLADDDKARATLREIEAIHARTNNVVSLYGSHWVAALIARNNDDLAEALDRGAKARTLLPKLPMPVMDFTSVTDIRAFMQMGDDRRALDLGLRVLDERASRGEFLPMPMIQRVCQAGIRVGEAARVAEHCRSVARNMAPSDQALARAYLGLIAAALKDERTSESEFAAAEALMAADHATRDMVWLFEGEAAAMRGDLATAEVLVNKAVARLREPGASRSARSSIAAALRLLGGWKVRAGQTVEACAPLAESRRLYAELGGEPGRLAVEGLLTAAGCPA